MNPITFPNLNLSFDINPVAFNIGDKPVYWYGIIITLGIVLAVLLARKRLKSDIVVDSKLKSFNYKFGLTFDDITDLCLWMIPIGIICARFYYVAFKWDYYSDHIEDIFKIWNGGIAIYGAIIGGFITGVIFCKIRKIRILNMADFCFPYVALCQSIGRWGNFVNREAYGETTDSILKMGIFENGAYKYVHPTFLYESICTFLIFIILINVSKHRKFNGETLYLYLILYGIARAFIEGMRTDSLYVGSTGIRVSQALSIVLVLVGIIGIAFTLLRTKLNKKA